jgi:hypothetical protein
LPGRIVGITIGFSRGDYDISKLGIVVFKELQLDSEVSGRVSCAGRKPFDGVDGVNSFNDASLDILASW